MLFRSLINKKVLEEGRIIGVETGGCPHTAIREDCSLNKNAVLDLENKYNPLDFVFVESGGDNLASSFSPELVDLSIYVIDVSAGDKIPRKGGPGITRSDLLLINKIDLADMVGADLNIMKNDTEFMRKGKPWFFTNLSRGIGVDSSGNKDEGAGDQGIMFGYACNETDVLMPAPIHYSHKILRLMAADRKSGKLKNIEPDSKSQVTFEYVEGKQIGRAHV